LTVNKENLYIKKPSTASVFLWRWRKYHPEQSKRFTLSVIKPFEYTTYTI